MIIDILLCEECEGEGGKASGSTNLVSLSVEEHMEEIVCKIEIIRC